VHLSFLSEVNKLTEIVLVIYVHETRIIKVIGLRNQIIPIETLTVFTSEKLIAYKVH